VFIGWPLGTMIGHFSGAGAVTFEGWSLGEAYKGYVLLGLIGPPAFWLLGHVAARVTSLVGAGEAIAMAAQKFVQPDEAAIANVQTVGSVVRIQMAALNAGIDDALIRLASAEAMIRQHVGAIEQAGAAVESRTSSAAERVAAERARLIDLTETLNVRADEFATAIAEKAQANIAALENAGTATLSAEARFDDRLARLEAAAQRALQSFEALSHALNEADAHMRTTGGAIEASAAEVKRASEVAAKIAEAASESAARNAANVGMFTGQAADRARKAADEAIETARREAERASESAIEFATREANRVTEAAARAVEDVRAATRSAVESAASDAEKAAAAAKLVSEAARLTTSAAREASEEVKKAGEAAQKSATDAVGLTEAAAQRIEARNKELAAARASLESENARLEALIDEQRKRADRLAEAIATQTERLSKLAENQLREQEAAARLAEAQAQMQQARAAEAAAEMERLARLEAERAAEAAKAEAERIAKEEAARAEAAKAEADAKAKKEAAEKDRHKARQPAGARANGASASNVLELGASSRRARAKTQDAAAAAAKLDDLAEAIARPKAARDQADPSKDDERRSKDGVSWREILSATDDAEPLDLGAATRESAEGREEAARAAANSAMKIIAGLQTFTLDLETRLYGEPPPALLERFERGDRNVFANRLLRLNEADVKRRIRAEGSRDKAFERGIHEFLQGFERLLEDATTSATADEELEEYLSSPLGRVYLLVGATVGYFA
ncbi:MAG: hypothetical protein HXY21_04710, partial [Parvularculaceae bacterium]|nr:hypothetical protein [Parvularculaceae bacterium]